MLNTSHLRTSRGKLRGERIKQVDNIEKLILRLKGLRWRHLTLFGFVLVVDLLDLATVDAQTTCWQDVLAILCRKRLSSGSVASSGSKMRASEIISLSSNRPSVKLRRSGSSSASTAACASRARTA